MTLCTFASWATDPSRWDEDTGAPGIALFGNAIQVWSCMQSGDTSVAQAAAAFNVSPERIEQAVNEHYWMYLGRNSEADGTPIIEHEGE